MTHGWVGFLPGVVGAEPVAPTGLVGDERSPCRAWPPWDMERELDRVSLPIQIRIRQPSGMKLTGRRWASPDGHRPVVCRLC